MRLGERMMVSVGRKPLKLEERTGLGWDRTQNMGEKVARADSRGQT